MKHISSNQFIHGADTQLPIYLKGDKAPFGIYLCIGYFDNDLDQGRLDLVNDACDAITDQRQDADRPNIRGRATPGFGIEGMNEPAQWDGMRYSQPHPYPTARGSCNWTWRSRV